jgi:hypothetical protein
MTFLSGTRLRSLLKKPPKARRDLVDGGAPGLVLRGRACWSLIVRVVGKGGASY